jgi:hypothetical protein
VEETYNFQAVTDAELAEVRRRDAIGRGAEQHCRNEIRRWLQRDMRRWGRRAQYQLNPWDDVCLQSGLEAAEEA